MKDYAIVLKFDDDSTAKINRIFDIIKAVCGEDVYTLPPHVTLATFRADDVSQVVKSLAETQFVGGYLIFTSVAMFVPKVPYLAPVLNECLLVNNKLANEIAMPFNDSKNTPSNFQFYLPNHWQPHCALAYKLDKDCLKKAINATIDSFELIVAVVTQVALVECEPYTEHEEWKWRV